MASKLKVGNARNRSCLGLEGYGVLWPYADVWPSGNQEYYDAAAIDGADKIKQFTRITLPLLTPTLFFVLIISLINSFQLFTQIMIMTPDGGPLGSTMVMVERIYKCGFRYYEMGTAAAYSWILFAILLLLTMVQMKLQNKWVNYDD